MQSFPSLNLLRSYHSTLDKQAIEKRQQENSTVISFQHFSSSDTTTNNNNSNSNKRPRTTNACDNCKKNKKACTGDEPCKLCEKKNLVCRYMNGGRRYQEKPHATRQDKNNTSTTTNNQPTIRPSTVSTLNNSMMVSIPPPPTPSDAKSDTSFSHFFVQDPCLNLFGYFGSTNVFSAESTSTSLKPTTITTTSPSQNLCHLNLPTCDQHYLLQIYCEHVDTFYPVFDLDYLKQQLHSSSPTCLNTLFFCAVFARAAYLVGHETTSNNLSFASFSTQFITYAQYIRDSFLDDPNPTCSTVLALLIMANHLECNRLRHQLPVAWKWAGEACTLALTMGLHAKESLSMDPVVYQLRLRTFWLTFITDYTLKTIHGRPFLFDETDISMGDKTSRGKHPAQLQCIGNEGAYTQRWLDRLKSTIYFCKGAKKIIKFNYSPQQKMDQHHPYYRGYLTTMDYWIYDAAKKEDSNLDNSTTNMDDEQQRRVQEMTPPVEGVEPWIQRLDRLNDLYFYADAMLLHKRYIENDTRQRSASFETCYQAAEQAISLATHLSTKELQVLSTSPITLYSIVMALQIMGACCLSLKTNQQQQQQQQQLISSAELLYEMGYHALHRLPIFQNPQSMMHDTLCHLWNLYNDYCATRKNGDILLLKPIINSSWSNEFDHPFNAFLVDTATAFIHQTTEVASTKGEQQMVGNVITSTLDANLSCQPTTTSHHPIVTKQPITLVDSLTTNRIDPEVIPVAVYETSFDPNDLTSTFGLSRSLDSQQWTIPTPNSFSSPTFSSMYSSPAQDMF